MPDAIEPALRHHVKHAAGNKKEIYLTASITSMRLAAGLAPHNPIKHAEVETGAVTPVPLDGPAAAAALVRL
ncbi:hypothetical protein [Hoeflea marina]|uniref:hypothetical protein n=1 Tax=Hoeflea marina TaxID=274592 RepID=UPI0011B756D0|nr:hypothetical protein [Hoeflea marina]